MGLHNVEGRLACVSKLQKCRLPTHSSPPPGYEKDLHKLRDQKPRNPKKTVECRCIPENFGFEDACAY